MTIDKKKFIRLVSASLVFMTLIGWIVIKFFQEISLIEQLHGEAPWYYQLAIGTVFGVITALIGWQIVRLPLLIEVKKFFSGLIGGLKLNLIEIIYISICAGTGEEILFRGGFQPLLGIWITSILFILIHGYINPKNLPLSIFGLYMVFVIAGIGYFSDKIGLLTAIVAHIVFDLVIVSLLKSAFQKGEEDK